MAGLRVPAGARRPTAYTDHMRPLLVLLTLILVASAAIAPTTSAAPTPAAPGPDGPGGYAPGELLAAFHQPPAPVQLQRLGLRLIEHYDRSNVARLQIAGSGTDPRPAIARLQASGLVAWAEPNFRLRVAEIIPDDPRYDEQARVWELLGAPAAWDVTTGSRRVVVAVLDGAIDLDHPDLVANIWTNAGEIPGNGIDDDGNGYVDDLHGYDFVGDFAGELDGVPGEDPDPDVALGDSAAGDGIDQDRDGVTDGAVGHGTRVAGIIAARGNDGIGVPGTAWQVRIMPVRVTDPEGNGFFSSLVRALDYAVANDADVVNISLAASFLPQAARVAIEAAAAAGIVLIGAAGNNGDSVAFPAAAPQVIAVGSHDSGARVDQRASFSPRRPGVDLVAPGRAVLTTNVQAGSADPGYIAATGTSFSAPFVAGAVALALSLEPALDAAAVRALLTGTATDLPDGLLPGWDGAGRLNLGAALETLRDRPPLQPDLNAIDLPAPDADFVITGRARPGSLVDLQELPGQAALGAATADADGRFRIELPVDRLPETQAQLTLAGIAADGDNASDRSPPLTFALPRIVVLFPGWNMTTWAGASAGGAGVLRDLPPQVSRIFTWTGRDWDLAVPGNALFTIDRITTGEGLWVFLNGDQTARWMQRRTAIPATRLANGWHLRAWSGPSGPAAAVPAAAVPAAAGGAMEVFFVWDPAAGVHLSYFPSRPRLSDLTQVAHLDALWLLLGGNGALWPAS